MSNVGNKKFKDAKLREHYEYLKSVGFTAEDYKKALEESKLKEDKANSILECTGNV